MLFVAIGLIILFLTFVFSLVMLIREMGQRANIEDSIGNYSLDFADEEASSEPETDKQETHYNDQDLDTSDKQDTNSNVLDTDEVVPFPWEVNSESLQASSENLEETRETIPASGRRQFSTQHPIRLNGEFSLSNKVDRE